MSAFASSEAAKVTFHGQQRIGASQFDSKGVAAKSSDVHITINVNSENPLSPATVQTTRVAIDGAAKGVQQSVAPVVAGDFVAKEGSGRESTPVSENDFSKTGPKAHKVGVSIYNVKGTSSGATMLVGHTDDQAIRIAKSVLATFTWDQSGLIVSTPEYTSFHYQLEGLAQADQRQYKLVRDAIYAQAHAEHHRFGDEKPVPPAEPIVEPQPVAFTPLEIEGPGAPVPATRHSNRCATIVGALVTIAGIVQLTLAGDNPDLEYQDGSGVPQALQFVAGGLITAAGLGTLGYQYYQSRG